MYDSIPSRDALALVETLGHPQRNLVLRTIRDRGTSVKLDELASRVEVDPGEENRQSGGAAKLHHVHLPKLHDAGVITYDADSQTVTALDEDRLDDLLTTGQRLLSSLRE